jgi:hypothetical protein
MGASGVKFTVTVVPCPAMLSIPMCQPYRSQMRLTKDSPTPNPALCRPL